VAAERLYDIVPDWERSSTVKGCIRAMLHEILQEKKKSKQLGRLIKIKSGLFDIVSISVIFYIPKSLN